MRNSIILALAIGCSTKPSGGGAGEKPASVVHPAGETEQAVVTLTAEAEKRIGLVTSKVSKSTVHRTKTVPGEVVVPSGGVATLVAPFAATVRPISGKQAMPKTGDVVHRNDKLLRLVPLAPADRDVRAQAEKAVTVAESRLQSAEQKLARLEKLLKDGAASDKQVEEARADRDALAAELSAAKKRVSTIASSPLSADVSVTLLAPHDGVVRLSPVTAGQLVAAGAPVLEIVQKNGFWVRAAVYAGDVIREGVAAQIGSLRSAAVQEANPIGAPPSADPNAATVDYFFELPPIPVRKPGERVTVTLELTGDEEVSTIAWSSVVFDAAGGAWVYEKTAPGKYTRRRVDIVRVAGDLAILARGPAVGAEIVSVGGGELFGVEFGAGH